MSEVSEANRRIARHIADAFGGVPTVRAYVDDKNGSAVDVLRSDDRPRDGVTSYSTIGLSDFLVPLDDGRAPVGIELAAACARSVDRMPNVLASAAIRMIRSGELYRPGSAIDGPMGLHVPSSPLPHLYFAAPFLWEGLTTVDVGTKRVTWLLAAPISDGERRFLRQHGDDALEDLFEERGIDVFDVYRPSVA